MEQAITAGCGLLTLRHFRVGNTEDAKAVVSETIVIGRKLFAEDWVTEFEAPATKWSRAQLLHSFDKRRPGQMSWFWAFYECLACCLVGQSFDEFTEIASWIEPRLKPEFLGGKDEVELCKLYVIMCYDLLERDLKNRTALEKAIAKGRPKRPKLLLESWRAVREGDQRSFDVAFSSSVKHFGKSYKPRCSIADAVAVHQSIVWMLAEHRGFSFPQKLDERHRAMLLTPQSLLD